MIETKRLDLRGPEWSTHPDGPLPPYAFSLVGIGPRAQVVFRDKQGLRRGDEVVLGAGQKVGALYKVVARTEVLGVITWFREIYALEFVGKVEPEEQAAKEQAVKQAVGAAP